MRILTIIATLLLTITAVAQENLPVQMEAEGQLKHSLWKTDG